MALTTFADVLAGLKAQLESDPVLGEFCRARWNRDRQVRIEFKHRVEIGFDELPLILITQPRVSRREVLAGGRVAWHRVRLYAGFQQNDRSQGVIDQLLFEELIDAAVLRDTTFGGLADESHVLDSVNDEGMHQPVYFCVMELDVLFTRKWADTNELDDFIQFHGEWDLAPADGERDATDDVYPPQN
jgi:hypothetical protein